MRIKGRSETGHFLPVLPLLGKKVVGRQPLMLLNKRTITAFFFGYKQLQNHQSNQGDKVNQVLMLRS